MNRGEIYWANLSPRSGSEQQGKRPVLLISNNGFNRSPNWKSVIVIPLSTSSQQKSRGLTTVTIPANTIGLSQESVVLCHQVMTLDRAKLGQNIGTLSPSLLQAVENALKAAMAL